MANTKQGNDIANKIATKNGNGNLTERPEADTVGALVGSMMIELKRSLPQHLSGNPDRILTIIAAVLRGSPKLLQCTRFSLIRAITEATRLGLEINSPLGECYLVPFCDKKGTYNVQLILSAKSMVKLAYQSGIIKNVQVRAVYPSDKFEFEYSFEPKFKHVPSGKTGENPVWYYAYYETISGGKDFFVWSREQALEHGEKYSQSFLSKDSPWKKFEDEMCKKTTIKKLLAYLPKSAEINKFLYTDEQVYSPEYIEPPVKTPIPIDEKTPDKVDKPDDDSLVDSEVDLLLEKKEVSEIFEGFKDE